MVVFSFLFFDWKYSFGGKFCPKSQNCQFKVKLDTYTNSNIKNSMAVFTFFVFDRRSPFWENSVQNLKTVSLRLNLVDSLIRIWRIQ